MCFYITSRNTLHSLNFTKIYAKYYIYVVASKSSRDSLVYKVISKISGLVPPSIQQL
jgi:hypothetical protein